MCLCEPASFHLHSRELVSLSEAGNLAQRLAMLRVPTLYVAASPGGIGERSLAMLAHAAIPVVTISPSGHCPHLDQPDAFAAALGLFLGRL